MPNTISKSEAARRKGCSINGIRGGIDRGDLDTDDDGFVLVDFRFRKFKPLEPGRQKKDDGQIWTLKAGMTASEKRAFKRKLHKRESYAAAARRILCS